MANEKKIEIKLIQTRYSQYPTETANKGLTNNWVLITQQDDESKYNADKLDVVLVPLKNEMITDLGSEEYNLETAIPVANDYDKDNLDLNYVKIIKIDNFKGNRFDKFWSKILNGINWVFGGNIYINVNNFSCYNLIFFLGGKVKNGYCYLLLKEKEEQVSDSNTTENILGYYKIKITPSTVYYIFLPWVKPRLFGLLLLFIFITLFIFNPVELIFLFLKDWLAMCNNDSFINEFFYSLVALTGFISFALEMVILSKEENPLTSMDECIIIFLSCVVVSIASFCALYSMMDMDIHNMEIAIRNNNFFRSLIECFRYL